MLAHCRYHRGTNLIEGTNNKIKVINCMTRCSREQEYFFLKMSAALPGIAR